MESKGLKISYEIKEFEELEGEKRKSNKEEKQEETEGRNEKGTNVLFFADAFRIRQILDNLISNAIK